MRYLGYIFMLFLVTAAVYAVFNIKDFLITWWRWIKSVGAGGWILIKKLWEMMMGWIGKR